MGILNRREPRSRSAIQTPPRTWGVDPEDHSFELGGGLDWQYFIIGKLTATGHLASFAVAKCRNTSSRGKAAKHRIGESTARFAL